MSGGFECLLMAWLWLGCVYLRNTTGSMMAKY